MTSDWLNRMHGGSYFSRRDRDLLRSLDWQARCGQPGCIMAASFTLDYHGCSPTVLLCAAHWGAVIAYFEGNRLQPWGQFNCPNCRQPFYDYKVFTGVLAL